MLGSAVLLAGCMSAKPVRLDEWGAARNCHFAHVTKKEFETAVRRVFDASGPKIYGLHPEEGAALVEQHWALDVVFASAAGVERWRLEYAPAEDGIDVHAELEHAPGDAPSGKTVSYELLWSRIEYVLGNRTDWPRCKSGPKLPGSGLCASDSSPPLKLARSR
ncbi:MAG TPA: hypothetical protein VHT03_07710 [Rhizomicrobium sp.]|nr:hypothetical protein [Rhizomicrobium sp.]